MALKIGKILLGKEKERKNLFDLTHDVSTTMDFGEVQPLMCRELVPGTDATVSVDSFVRLAPLPVPTFGRASMKTFHTFVPLQDIWCGFEYFMSKKPFTNGSSVYIPNKVPFITQQALTLEVLKGCSVSLYDESASVEGGLEFRKLKLVTNLATFNSKINHAYSVMNWDSYVDTSSLNFLPMLSKETAVTLEEADFVVRCDDQPGTNHVVCIKLSHEASRLRKLLIGLGYQLQLEGGAEDVELSIMPLVAYYKAYFDIFVPQQNITWTQTSAYHLMETIELFNWPNVTTQFIVNPVEDYRLQWNNFVAELRDCWYTDNVNYYSAHTTKPEINSVSNSVKTTGLSGNLATSTITQEVDSQPSVGGVITQAQLNILKKMYSWANKNTIIGGKIADYMRVHYGSDVLDDVKSNFIGSGRTDIQISDLFATADTETASLGEFAGKGVGYSNGSNLHFKADVFGYWITMASIVPESDYCQAIDGCLDHIQPEQFFTPMYDAVGYQITPKYKVVADGSIADTNSQIDISAGFGYIPRYTEYKVMSNILNGDISKRSTKDSMLPFTLDKYISDSEVTGEYDPASGNYSAVTYSFNNRRYLPVGSPSWRYVGKYGWLDNFNRIFLNNEDRNLLSEYGSYFDIDRPDNFIVHNVINVKLNAPMLQISDSFETESNDDSVAVEKQ